MNGSDSDPKDSVTEVAEDSFVRERPSEIERGTVLAGRYQVEDVVGTGGSGIVLRVFDRTAQNVVALKVLKAELARDAKWEKRFSRELRLGRPIQHPNVCRIFDIGEADGHRFLTMELARGGSLRDELKHHRSIERAIEARLADARAVVAGLAALHAAGVVHRDFKPDNILRMEDGRLVLSDFGLATDAANAPGATVLIGTPHYMAPEVLAGEPATSRSDVWALGVVLHEIFFGRRPERRSVSFDGSSKGPLRPNSSVERAMVALCDRCLADSPFDRPPDAGAVAQMLDNGRASRQSLWRRPKAGVFVLSGLVLASIAGVVAIRRQRLVVETASKNSPSIIHVEPTGKALDWSKAASVLAELPGRVHCVTLMDENTVRLIWGTPRRAEDLDLTTGHRHPSPLVPDSYRVGCPESSPNRRALVFTGQSEAGAPQITLSNFPDGHDASTVTAGSDPVWLGSNDEFVFNVDASHLATFSVPTMTSSLWPAPVAGTQYVILDKTVDRSGNTLAVLLGGSSGSAVAIYDGWTKLNPIMFSIPVWSRIQFGARLDALLVSYRVSKQMSAIAELDWRAGKYTNLGSYPGFDPIWLDHAGAHDLLVVRHVASDVWLDDGSEPRRVTTDGENYSAAVSASNELLLSKPDDDGNFDIWWRDRSGALREVTHGKMDVEPDFGPDGRSWAYADYTDKSINLCQDMVGVCRVLRKDELLPSWPRFSPDGEHLAYLTEIGSPKATVVSTKDGQIQSSWGAYYQCPPVWSSATTLWTLEASARHYFWSERDTRTGAKTGQRVEAPNENVDLGEVDCWPQVTTRNTPLAQRARIKAEEVSRLLRLERPQ